MKTVVFYEHADAPMEKFKEVYPKHQIVEDEFMNAGKIIGSGAFAIPGEDAISIFVDKNSAEDFVKKDPFVLEGLITKDEVL